MKIGLIGCGSIAQVHAKSIQALGDPYRLAAVADCDPERAAKMSEEYGAVPYQDWRALLDREQPDVVHICTPHHLHTPMAAEALRRGVSVFMEKPPVINWEQYDELKAAALEAKDGARLAVCFQNRFRADVRYAQTLLQEERLGRLLGMKGFVTWCRQAAYYMQSSWRGRLDTEGGGALINQGIHTLDLMQYLIGTAPVSVEAVQTNFHLQGLSEVEDTMTAYIRYPDAQAIFYATTAYVADSPTVVEMQFERGCVRLEEDRVSVRGADGSREELDLPAKKGFGKSYWGAGHEDAIGGFYTSITERTPYLLDFDRVEETVKLMLRIYDSARRDDR